MVCRRNNSFLKYATVKLAKECSSTIRARMKFVSAFYHTLAYVLIPLKLINSLLKPMQVHTEDAKIEEDNNRLPVCLSDSK